MNKLESTTLNIIRFVMSVGILFYHSYTSVQLCPLLKKLPVYEQVTRVFSMQFGEVAVPTFFIISGYLFFMGTNKHGIAGKVNCIGAFTPC